MANAAMPSLRVAARAPCTRAEGPGARFALWLQGCSIRCPGCCNPHLFEASSGPLVTVAALLDEIAAAPEPIEGITVLGGEPFDQAEGLAALVHAVAARGLSVVVFTGFTIEDLRARGGAASDALRAIDVLVDGRYHADEPERDRLWVGSRNQRFHYLSGRYTAAIERPAAGRAHERVEVRIDPSGSVSANGWPTF